uniref:Uncharacterized protein n=1 Tax=Knipowitschia caucasica TaxID=637954 RepID=A0AAV2MD34_KNICA
MHHKRWDRCCERESKAVTPPPHPKRCWLSDALSAKALKTRYNQRRILFSLGLVHIFGCKSPDRLHLQHTFCG